MPDSTHPTLSLTPPPAEAPKTPRARQSVPMYLMERCGEEKDQSGRQKWVFASREQYKDEASALKAAKAIGAPGTVYCVVRARAPFRLREETIAKRSLGEV